MSQIDNKSPVITTQVTTSGQWGSVTVELTNTYSTPVDLNGAVVSFENTDGYGVNGAPWGPLLDSTGGSATVKTKQEGTSLKSLITLHWSAAYLLNSKASTSFMFTLSGAANQTSFIGANTSLVEDPTAPLYLILEAPIAPYLAPYLPLLLVPPDPRDSESVTVNVYAQSEVLRTVSVPLGGKLQVDHLFAGKYQIKPQPVKKDNATYRPKPALISFDLTPLTKDTPVTWSYKEPEISVPVLFRVPEIAGESAVYTVMTLNREKYRLKFGSMRYLDLIVGKEYQMQFEPKVVNNQSYLLSYNDNKYTPSNNQNIVDLLVSPSSVNTGGFISIGIVVTGIPNTEEQVVVNLREKAENGCTYIYAVPARGLTNIGLIKPGTYAVFAESIVVNGVIYKLVEQTIVIDSSSKNITVNFKEGFPLTVRGWPTHLVHGSVTNNAETNDASIAKKYDTRPMGSIFKYAGIGGNGDPNDILNPATIPTHDTIENSRRMEQAQGHPVMPVMVFYTANFSGGPNGEDLKGDTLYMHFINFINELIVAESYKDADHPCPASYVLNPDFLGTLQQNQNVPGSPISDLFQPGSVPINEQLPPAMKYVLDNTPNLTDEQENALSANPPDFEEDIYGYIQAINWIMSTFGPDLPFGWQVNLWGPGSSTWIYGDLDQTKTAANSVASFIDQMKVYQGAYSGGDFSVFDKYERDDYSPDSLPSYAFDSIAWEHYLVYVEMISSHLKLPAMLWQISGGRMPNKKEGSSLVSNGHAGSGGTFFMGDLSIGSNLNNIVGALRSLALPSSGPYGGAKTVGQLLEKTPDFDWGPQRLKQAVSSNAFSFEWGGGDSTSIASVISGTDDVWLAKQVAEYYLDPIELPSK